LRKNYKKIFILIISPLFYLLINNFLFNNTTVYAQGQFTNTTNVSFKLDTESADGMYVFESTPNFEEIYKINDISSYIDDWPSDWTGNKPNPLVKQCGNNKFWISAEISLTSSGSRSYKRGILDLNSGNITSYNDQIPWYIFDVECNNDGTIYVVGMDNDKGKIAKIQNGTITDITSKFSSFGYIYRFLDIDYNGEYYLIASQYGYLYRMDSNENVEKSEYRHSYAFDSIEWSEDKQKWLVSPYNSSGGIAWYDGQNFEKISNLTAKNIYVSENQTLLTSTLAVGYKLYTYDNENTFKEINFPTGTFGVKNKYNRYYTFGSASWTGQYWLVYLTDQYSSSKVFAVYNSQLYFVGEYDMGLNVMLNEGYLLGAFQAKLVNFSPQNSFSQDIDFTLGDIEGNHTVNIWIYNQNNVTLETQNYVLDKTAPTKAEIFPITSDLTCEKSVLIKWNNSTDNLGKVTYEISINGDLIGKTEDTKFEINFEDLTIGQDNELTVKAIDEANNYSISEPYNLKIPSLKITINKVNDFEVEDGKVTIDTNDEINFSGNTSSICKVILRWEDKIFKLDEEITSSTDWIWDFPGSLKNGEYKFKFIAECGYQHEEYILELTIDGDEEIKTEIEETEFEIVTESEESEDNNNENDNKSDKTKLFIFIGVGILSVSVIVAYLVKKGKIELWNKKTE